MAGGAVEVVVATQPLTLVNLDPPTTMPAHFLAQDVEVRSMLILDQNPEAAIWSQNAGAGFQELLGLQAFVLVLGPMDLAALPWRDRTRENKLGTSSGTSCQSNKALCVDDFPMSIDNL